MADLPEELLEQVETLTRRARRSDVEAEAEAYRERRDALLAEEGFVARVREEESRDVLVCHPADWVEDGVVRTGNVDDVERAAEIPLSGPGDPDRWEAVDEHNRDAAAAVEAAHGAAHGANAAAFAEYMSNHLAKPMEDATPEEVARFLEDYYVRNVWPSAEEAARVEESVELARAVASERDGRS